MLFLTACTPAVVDLGKQESEPLVVVEDSDSKPVEDSSEEIPASPVLGKVKIEPEGGAFIEELAVVLSIEDGEGSLRYCLTAPEDLECSWKEYTEPILLHTSAVLRAEVTLEEEVSKQKAVNFVELDSELESFSSTIPVMVFWTNQSAPDSDEDVALGLTVLEPGANGSLNLLDVPTNNGRARLHIRGSSSAGFDKKAYDMELWESIDNSDRNDALLGMPENGDWILYAPYYYDEALVRNPLAYGLSNALGQYASRTRMVEVFLASRDQAVSNAHYLGVYALTEEIEVNENRVDITPMLSTDIAEPEVSGGYLFKIDRTGEGERGFSAGSGGGRWEFQQGWVNVTPSEAEIEREQSSWLISRIDSVGNALVMPDFTDPATGLHYSELIDIDSFIDHHIVNVYMKNPDAFRLSGYFYKDREGLIIAGPVWDFDRTAGSADSRSYDPSWWDNWNETTDCTNVWDFGWYKGLFTDPAFADRYWTRFENVLQNELSDESVDALIDSIAAGLDAGPAARNQDRWGAASYPSKLAELKGWLHTRHAWMLACIQQYADPRVCTGN
jgi:hypothetical protein